MIVSQLKQIQDQKNTKERLVYLLSAPVVEVEAGTEDTSVLTGVNRKEFPTQLRLSQQQTQDH